MDNNDLKQYSDPEEYSLIILISANEVRICFDPTSATTMPAMAICESWITPSSPADSNILPKIEKVIYDNPDVLGDYAARIIIATDMMLAFPMQMSDEAAAAAMAKVYACEPEDVMVEDCGKIKLTFFLTPGLKSFVDRTFPGAKLCHPLSEMIKRFSLDNQREQRVYVHLESGLMSMIAFEGKRLLHASQHRIAEMPDAVYYIYMLVQELGFYADEAEIFVSGPKAQRQELSKLLRRNINYVSYTPLPPVEYEDCPMAVALSAGMIRKK